MSREAEARLAAGGPGAPEPVPPRVLERVLLQLLPSGPVGDSIVGDLHEEHARLVRTSGARAAASWYRRQAFGVAWRGARDRVRGRGPFITHSPALPVGPRGRDPMMSSMLRAARYGLKGLARSPQFTLAAVVTLALAIGTNTAVFSVVQGVLLKPLNYHEAERLVMLRHTAPGLGYPEFGISPGLYDLYTSESTAFQSSGIYMEATVNVTGHDAPPSRITAARVSRDAFTTLGVSPAAGRIFDAPEEQAGGPAVVLLSHGLWQERYGADPALVGRTVDIDGQARTVVGVMPEGFEFPDRDTRLWLPLPLEGMESQFGAFQYQSVARLAAGVDAAQAQAQLAPLMSRVPDLAEDGSGFAAFIETGRLSAVVKPMKEVMVGDVSRALWILLGTVAFVFLIACANVTNLFLVRSEARHKEMAVRAAMGAGRSGLIGHYAAESLLIAAAGGVAGLALAAAMLKGLLYIAPPNIPRLHEVGLDPVVIGFTVVVTALAAVLLGILPSLRLTSPDLLATLSRTARGTSAGRERHRARQSLVIAQTALALVLLVGSGLMVRSFQQIRAIEPGFEPKDAVTFRLSLPESAYDDADHVAQFHAQLSDRLGALPGVESVGATSHPPMAGCCTGTAFLIEERPLEQGEMPPMFWYSTVSSGYFDVMRVPIRAGRPFDAFDGDAGRRSVIVSQTLATQIWPDADPVGKRIRPAAQDSGWYTVVGVVGDVRDQSLEREPGPMVYFPVTGWGSLERQPGFPGVAEQARSMTYVIRTTQTEALAPLARAEVWAIDPNLPIAASATYEKIVDDSMVRLSFTMLALVAASVIALILGAIGLYSVISYIVAQRTNEIGIRLALGARPTEVRRMVVLQGAKLAAMGLVIGFVAALGLTRLMQGMLFDTRPTDPLTFIAVSAVLAGVALLASYVPALRASRIDPASSLKAE
jgi:putative ABC transport system permease protein